MIHGSAYTALTLAGAALAALALTAAPATAQDVAGFYKGKTVNLLIGTGAGGEYDLHARLTGRHIGRHIPGNPTIVPQNMTGAGGIKMANFLYNVAPKDGTHIGMLANTLPMLQATGGPGLQLDVSKFLWIGSISPTVETLAVWHTAGVKSFEDLKSKEIVAGASGKGAMTHTFPTLMNKLLGTKIKVVTGYQGGNAINHAMERGELHARNNTWSSWKVTRPQWLKENKIVIAVYGGPKPTDLKDVPSVAELAKSEEDRKVIELLISGTEFGRPLGFTPGVPADRVKAVRAAFDATMKDKAFLAEAKKLRVEVEPVRGERLQKLAEQLVATPKPVAARAKAILEE